MKKKLTLIAVTIALLALVITPTVVFAQDTATTNIRPIKDGLAIVAPHVTPVGQEISMAVFQCSDQIPVEGAGVWLVTPEKIELLKGELSNTKKNGEDQDSKTEELLGIHGTFLGLTNADGKLYHTFNIAGRYSLVTFKRGYWPDVRAIVSGNVTTPSLVIDAPNRAEVGEKITITVTQNDTQEPVKDAGVWALSREKAEALKAEMSAQKANGDQEALLAQVENTLNINGIFLGTTNGAGKLDYTFEEAGGYLLVTFKRGYLPGFKGILIGSLPKVLVIDAPLKAKVDEKITITVTEKATQDAVKDAGVWALTRENAVTVKEEITALRASGADAETIQAQIESLLNAQAIFLGTTNGAGKVDYAFENAGGYLLVAFKPGYWPGLKGILIVENTVQVSTSNASSIVK